MLNFSVGISWWWFLANIFPLLFKMLYNCGRLLWLTTIPFLSQRFCSLVRIRKISGSLHLKFWVSVCFLVAVFWVHGISKGKVVLNFWPNDFSAGELPFWSDCEFRDSIARKWSSELSFALLRVQFEWILLLSHLIGGNDG